MKERKVNTEIKLKDTDVLENEDIFICGGMILYERIDCGGHNLKSCEHTTLMEDRNQ